jgi:hypothetical protein
LSPRAFAITPPICASACAVASCTRTGAPEAHATLVDIAAAAATAASDLRPYVRLEPFTARRIFIISPTVSLSRASSAAVASRLRTDARSAIAP